MTWFGTTILIVGACYLSFLTGQKTYPYKHKATLFFLNDNKISPVSPAKESKFIVEHSTKIRKSLRCYETKEK